MAPTTLTRTLETLDALEGVRWVDVRTAEEHAQGHIPGSISLPVLDFAQRAAVSEVYYRDGLMAAKLVAVDLVGPRLGGLAREVAALAARGTVALYCWRGGMRSGMLAGFLESVGVPVLVLEGGYRSHRRAVVATLAQPWPTPVVLHGCTGAGKTRLLRSLADRLPILDLEALANHRGSTFGAVGLAPQPTQRQFESELARHRLRIGTGRFLVEAESATIGAVQLPDSLCNAMRSGRRLFVDMPREVRVKHLLEDYGQALVTEPHTFRAGLKFLSARIPGPRRRELADLIECGDAAQLCLRLLEWHYDPLYERWRRKVGLDFDRVIAVADLNQAERQLEALLISPETSMDEGLAHATNPTVGCPVRILPGG